MTAFEGLHLSPWFLNSRRLNEVSNYRIPSDAQISLSQNTALRAHAMSIALGVADRVLTRSKLDSLINVYDQLSQEDWKECYIWDVITLRGVGAAITQGRNGEVKEPASFGSHVQIGDRSVHVHGQLLNEHLEAVLF